MVICSTSGTGESNATTTGVPTQGGSRVSPLRPRWVASSLTASPSARCRPKGSRRPGRAGSMRRMLAGHTSSSRVRRRPLSSARENQLRSSVCRLNSTGRNSTFKVEPSRLSTSAVRQTSGSGSHNALRNRLTPPSVTGTRNSMSSVAPTASASVGVALR